MNPGQKCTSCENVYTGDNSKGQWWGCNNYFKISGFFCPTCYRMISHDCYQQPHDPEGYLLMLIKLGATG
jgi:hypothetical protein